MFSGGCSAQNGVPRVTGQGQPVLRRAGQISDTPCEWTAARDIDHMQLGAFALFAMAAADGARSGRGGCQA